MYAKKLFLWLDPCVRKRGKGMPTAEEGRPVFSYCDSALKIL